MRDYKRVQRNFGIETFVVVLIVVVVSHMGSYVKTDFIIRLKYVVYCISIIPQKTVSNH